MKIILTGYNRGQVGYSSEDPSIELNTELMPHIPRIGETVEIEGKFYLEITKVEYYINVHDSSKSVIYIRGVIL